MDSKTYLMQALVSRVITADSPEEAKECCGEWASGYCDDFGDVVSCSVLPMGTMTVNTKDGPL